jgi:hypothetical protein
MKMTEPNRSRALSLAACIILAALLAVAYPLKVQKDMSDFGVCYKAGQRIVSAEALYKASDGHRQYKYAPVAADFYVLFGMLPWRVAKLLWYILTLGLLAGLAAISYRILPQPKKPPLVLLGLTFLVMAKCLGRELQLGQVNILILFLLVGMSALFLAKKDLDAGALWGISLFFKPYALVFLPYFLLKKRFRVLAGGAAVVLAGLMLPIVNFGFRGNLLAIKEWALSLSRSTPALLTVGDNASLFGIILKLSGGRWTAASVIALGTCVLILGLGLLVMIFARNNEEAEGAGWIQRGETSELAYLILLIPLLSPLGWNYNYLYGFLAVMIVLNRMNEFPLGLRILAVTNLVLIGATLRETLGRPLFELYTRHSLVVVNFVIILALLLGLQRKPNSASG